MQKPAVKGRFWKLSQLLVFGVYFWLLTPFIEGMESVTHSYNSNMLAVALMALFFTVLTFAPVMWIQMWWKRRSFTQLPGAEYRRQRDPLQR